MKATVFLVSCTFSPMSPGSILHRIIVIVTHVIRLTEVLPLVEFFLEEGMTDEEAVHILDMSVPKKKKERSWKENRMGSIL